MSSHMDGIQKIEVQAVPKATPKGRDCMDIPARRMICMAKLPDVQREATRGIPIASFLATPRFSDFHRSAAISHHSAVPVANPSA